jgi:hypothetical protein
MMRAHKAACAIRFREILTMLFHKRGFHRGGGVAVLLTIIMVFAAVPLRAARLE